MTRATEPTPSPEHVHEWRPVEAKHLRVCNCGNVWFASDAEVRGSLEAPLGPRTAAGQDHVRIWGPMADRDGPLAGQPEPEFVADVLAIEAEARGSLDDRLSEAPLDAAWKAAEAFGWPRLMVARNDTRGGYTAAAGTLMELAARTEGDSPAAALTALEAALAERLRSGS